MSAVTRYLGRGERVVMEVHRHMSVLLRPFFAALGAILLAVFVGFLTSPDEGNGILDTIFGVVAAFFVLRLAWKVLEWQADRIVVTDQRVFEVCGILTRKVASMPLKKVSDMTYRRSIAGRILGYGEVIVESAGQDQALSHIHHLPDPDHFYRTITSLLTSGEPAVDPLGRSTYPEDVDTGPLPRVIV